MQHQLIGQHNAGSLLWGMRIDGFETDRWDLWGAGICLIGVAIMI